MNIKYITTGKEFTILENEEKPPPQKKNMKINETTIVISSISGDRNTTELSEIRIVPRDGIHCNNPMDTVRIDRTWFFCLESKTWLKVKKLKKPMKVIMGDSLSGLSSIKKKLLLKIDATPEAIINVIKIIVADFIILF